MGAPRDVTAPGGKGRLPPPGLSTPWTGQGAWDGRLDLAWRMAGGLRNYFRGFQLMHWLLRVFASAIVRRIAYVLVAVALAWLGLSDAHAQTQQCATTSAGCTEPGAYSACRSELASYVAARKDFANQNQQCVVIGTKVIQSRFQYKTGASSPWYSGNYRTYTWSKGCDQEEPYTGTGPWSSTGGSARSGSVGCRKGCDGMWGKNADSSFTWSPTGAVCPEDERKNCESPAMANSGYYWNVALSVCEPPKHECAGGKNPNSLGQCAPEPCPEGMAQQADGTCKKKDNECPAGQVRSPDGKCLPGDGQCAAGEVRGPDGTCKKDGDGDGKPDEPGAKDTFSGGDDCNAPPSCSGSPIMCGQARIQWRIDCNTRKNRNIAGGLCSSMPICTGEKCDAMEYAGLLMQWRSACALEKMASSTGTGGGDGADVKAIRDALTGTGGSVTTAPDRPSSDVWSPRSGTSVKPDTGGYGWGRSCPQPPSFEVFGNVIQINTAPLCNWLILGSYFVMGLAALASLRIIATRDA